MTERELQEIKMSEQNELAPRVGGDGDGASGDGRGDYRGARPGSSRERDWLKSPLEIQKAIEQLIVLVAMGVMPERRANILISALKAQLECFKAGEGKAASQSGPEPDIDAAARCFEKNPDLLRDLAPLLNPEALQDIIRRMSESR